MVFLKLLFQVIVALPTIVGAVSDLIKYFKKKEIQGAANETKNGDTSKLESIVNK